MAHQRKNLKDWLRVLSGEDYQIIKQSDKIARVDFALIGGVVCSVFFGCFWSAKLFFTQLFHNHFLAAAIGLIWAFTIINIYLLLLYTISPTLLKSKISIRNFSLTKRDQKQSALFALIFRISFIILLAFLIAQPVKVWLAEMTYNEQLNEHVAKHKQLIRAEALLEGCLLTKNEEKQLLDDIIQQITFGITGNILLKEKIEADVARVEHCLLLKKEIDSLYKCKSLNKQLVNSKKATLQNYALAIHDNDIKSVSTYPADSNEAAFKQLVQSRINNFSKTDELISYSNFYIRKIQLVDSEFTKLSVGSVCVIVLVFLFPIFWKFDIRGKSNFYEKKKDIENRIVLEDYFHFKEVYSTIFKDVIDKKIEFFESYTDPPFNTIKKSDIEYCNSQENLLKLIYGSAEK